MKGLRFALLVVEAWLALLRFDLALRIGRRTGVEPLPGRSWRPRRGDVGAIVAALDAATCWYWKPTLCLQRSVSLARLLRTRGIDARVVIGVRTMPLMSHAWVDVDGHIVDGNEGYARRLQVLCTL